MQALVLSELLVGFEYFTFLSLAAFHCWQVILQYFVFDCKNQLLALEIWGDVFVLLGFDLFLFSFFKTNEVKETAKMAAHFCLHF